MPGPSPFEKVIVVELASVLAGPSVGMFLAELGATVIKVENHKAGGDVTRSWKLASEDAHTDVSAYFSSVNWGKKSIGVDLTTDQGRSLIYALVQRAGIVISSFKPGDDRKLKMDYETLRSHNPALIMASLSAYGSEDARTGFDAIIQAEAGFMHMNGNAESGPLKMPVALMDVLAAHQLKEALLLAWIQKLQTGEGSHVTTNLLAAGVSSLVNQAANFLVAGVEPGRMGSGHPNIAPYGSSYETRDGRQIVIAAGNDRQFVLLCECVGAPALAANPSFASNPLRVQHRHELESALKQAIAQCNSGELMQKLNAAKVPAGLVLRMGEVFEQPAALAQRLGSNGLRTVAFQGLSALLALEAPPSLGAHTDEVLHQLAGLNETEIQTLKAEGVIR